MRRIVLVALSIVLVVATCCAFALLVVMIAPWERGL